MSAAKRVAPTRGPLHRWAILIPLGLEAWYELGQCLLHADPTREELRRVAECNGARAPFPEDEIWIERSAITVTDDGNTILMFERMQSHV